MDWIQGGPLISALLLRLTIKKPNVYPSPRLSHSRVTNRMTFSDHSLTAAGEIHGSHAALQGAADPNRSALPTGSPQGAHREPSPAVVQTLSAGAECAISAGFNHAVSICEGGSLERISFSCRKMGQTWGRGRGGGAGCICTAHCVYWLSSPLS